MLGARLSPDQRTCLAVVGAAAVVYATTLCPTVHWYDSAELSAHAAALGVPHPPGYPTYTLIAHAFTWLPGEPALGVNVMSLVFGLVSVGLLYQLARGLGVGRAAAAVGAATLAVLPSVWCNAVVAEVYTPGLAFSLGTFELLRRGLDQRRPRLLVLAALVAGIGVGAHMSIATLGLGYVFLVASYRVEVERPAQPWPALRRDWRPRLAVALGSLGALAFGLCVFLYIPLRRFQRWDRREWINFLKNASGGRFKRKFLHGYDLGERIEFVGGLLVDNLHWIGLALAVVGLVALARRRPRWGVALLLAVGGNIWWFFNYDVPDLDVFLVPSLAIGAMGYGAGLEALGGLVARRWRYGAHAPLLGLGLPLWLLVASHERFDMSHATDARAYGDAVCEQLPAGSVIIHYAKPEEWRRYSVILYMQKALGRCEAVSIIQRPRNEQLGALVDDGRPIYTLIPRNLAWGRTQPDGVLFRLETPP